jgi:hypothetical protein
LRQTPSKHSSVLTLAHLFSVSMPKVMGCIWSATGTPLTSSCCWWFGFNSCWE